MRDSLHEIYEGSWLQRTISYFQWPSFSEADMAEAQILLDVCNPNTWHYARLRIWPTEMIPIPITGFDLVFPTPCPISAWRLVFDYCLPTNGKAVLYAMRTGQAIPVTDLELAARLAAYQQQLSRNRVANVP